MRKLTQKVKRELVDYFGHNRTEFVFLFVIFCIALFVRTFRLSDLLGFYYDQGRDALVIWNLWHQGKLFLVGPVTGLEGIFLGPFYYYLIAPFYLIGRGNPVVPAAFLALLSVAAIYLIYVIASKFHSKAAGVIAVLISSFSYYMVLAGRWLSNPTPIMFSSALLLWFMYKLMESRNQKYWVAIWAAVGVSMHFESASAIFFFPMIVVFALWLHFNGQVLKSAAFPRGNVFWIAAGVFLVTLLPQIIFNFRHDNLLFGNIRKIFIEGEKGGGFGLDIQTVLPIRAKYFWGVFSSKIMPGKGNLLTAYTWVSIIGLLSLNRARKKVTLLLIFLGVPMMGYIFFQGNYGNIFDYYMTGYYLPMILLFSIGLAQVWKYAFGKFVVIAFFISFGIINLPLIKNNLDIEINDPLHITLGSQLRGVNWIFDDAQEKKVNSFNVDIYVPPVISYSYDYLLLWQGTKICGDNLCGIVNEGQNVVYVLFEIDPPHPERLEAWMEKYFRSTVLLEEQIFGGVHVQRRQRI